MMENLGMLLDIPRALELILRSLLCWQEFEFVNGVGLLDFLRLELRGVDWTSFASLPPVSPTI